MAEPRKQFTFYRSYFDAIQELSKKDQAAIILSVCAYAIYEAEPKGLSPAASTAFQLIRPTLDAGRVKAEIGKQGGSKPKANSKQSGSKPKANSKQSGSKPEANSKQSGREKEGEKEIEIEKEKEIEKEVEVEGEGLASAARDKKLKMMQGELGKGVVALTDEQTEHLLKRLGPDMFDFYVDKLSAFIVKNGAWVKNHYETILRWYHEDGYAGRAGRSNKPGGNMQKERQLDAEEIAAIRRMMADDAL